MTAAHSCVPVPCAPPPVGPVGVWCVYLPFAASPLVVGAPGREPPNTPPVAPGRGGHDLAIADVDSN